jgi:hypothetical protein
VQIEQYKKQLAPFLEIQDMDNEGYIRVKIEN